MCCHTTYASCWEHLFPYPMLRKLTCPVADVEDLSCMVMPTRSVVVFIMRIVVVFIMRMLIILMGMPTVIMIIIIMMCEVAIIMNVLAISTDTPTVRDNLREITSFKSVATTVVSTSPHA